MTPQDIQQQVELYKSISEKLMEENPNLKELDWEIRDVPYRVFNEFRKSIKGSDVNKEEIPCNDRVYCRPLFSYGKGCSVYVWSVPIKIITHVEVAELQET